MTDQDKDKLIVKSLGECWHEWKGTDDEWNKFTCLKCSAISQELKLQFSVVPYDLATWEGFGWWWERAQEMEWWNDFRNWSFLRAYEEIKKGFNCTKMDEWLINPIRGRDAVVEFLSEVKYERRANTGVN